MKTDDRNVRIRVSIHLLLFGLSVYLAWVSARHWWNAKRYLESFEYIGNWDYNTDALVWREDIFGVILRDWVIPQWLPFFVISVSMPIVIGLALIGVARCKMCLRIGLGSTAPLLFSFLIANAMTLEMFLFFCASGGASRGVVRCHQPRLWKLGHPREPGERGYDQRLDLGA